MRACAVRMDHSPWFIAPASPNAVMGITSSFGSPIRKAMTIVVQKVTVWSSSALPGLNASISLKPEGAAITDDTPLFLFSLRTNRTNRTKRPICPPSTGRGRTGRDPYRGSSASAVDVRSVLFIRSRDVVDDEPDPIDEAGADLLCLHEALFDRALTGTLEGVALGIGRLHRVIVIGGIFGGRTPRAPSRDERPSPWGLAAHKAAARCRNPRAPAQGTL